MNEVVDRPRRKKSKSALNIFQFAETVEAGAWDDERQKQEIQVSTESIQASCTTGLIVPFILQKRISVLARESAQKEATIPSGGVPSSGPADSKVPADVPTPPRAPTTSPFHTKSEEPGKQYTIVRSEAAPSISEPGMRQRALTAP